MSPSCPKMVPKLVWKAPGGQLGRPMWTRFRFKGALEELSGPTLGPSWPQEGPWMRQRGATLQKRKKSWFLEDLLDGPVDVTRTGLGFQRAKIDRNATQKGSK